VLEAGGAVSIVRTPIDERRESGVRRGVFIGEDFGGSSLDFFQRFFEKDVDEQKLKCSF
jgi:hypothetical protein